MNSYPSMGSASSIAQFYHQAAAVSAAGAVGMDTLGSACSQLSSGGLSSVGTGQALSEITRHPWLVPTGESRCMSLISKRMFLF
jgi:Antp family protein